jgi:hypothetical protein
MAMVDSGLGWSCHSAFFVNQAGTKLGTVDDRQYTKNNNGPAIAFLKIIPNDWCGPVLISTLAANVSTNYGGYTNSATINGITWYMNENGHIKNPRAYDSQGLSIANYYDIIDNTLPGDWAAKYIGPVLKYTSNDPIGGTNKTIPVRWNNLETSFEITVM